MERASRRAVPRRFAVSIRPRRAGRRPGLGPRRGRRAGRQPRRRTSGPPVGHGGGRSVPGAGRRARSGARLAGPRRRGREPGGSRRGGRGSRRGHGHRPAPERPGPRGPAPQLRLLRRLAAWEPRVGHRAEPSGAGGMDGRGQQARSRRRHSGTWPSPASTSAGWTRPATCVLQAAEVWRELDDPASLAHVQITQADIARLRGDLAAAEALYDQVLVELATIGDRRCTASTFKNLGMIAVCRGDREAQHRAVPGRGPPAARAWRRGRSGRVPGRAGRGELGGRSPRHRRRRCWRLPPHSGRGRDPTPPPTSRR